MYGRRLHRRFDQKEIHRCPIRMRLLCMLLLIIAIVSWLSNIVFLVTTIYLHFRELPVHKTTPLYSYNPIQVSKGAELYNASNKPEIPRNGFSSSRTAKGTVALVQFFQPRDEESTQLMLYSVFNKLHYAKRHGYSYYLYNTPVFRFRSLTWNKINAIRQTLDLPFVEWVLFLDVDTIVMRTECSFRSIWDLIVTYHAPEDQKTVELIVTIDGKGINSGVMLIRNTERMRKMFQRTLSLGNFQKPWDWMREQRAIGTEIEKPYVRDCVLSSQTFEDLLNAYPGFYVDNETWTFHDPGCSSDCLRKYLNFYDLWIENEERLRPSLCRGEKLVCCHLVPQTEETHCVDETFPKQCSDNDDQLATLAREWAREGANPLGIRLRLGQMKS